MPDPECLRERVAEPIGEYVAERESQRFGQRLRVPEPLGLARARPASAVPCVEEHDGAVARDHLVAQDLQLRQDTGVLQHG